MKFEANIPSYLKTGSGSFPVGDTGVSKRKKPTNFYEQAQQGFELSTTTEDIQQIYSPQGMTSKIEPNFFKAMQADTRPEGILDDIRDLRRYLFLIDAEMCGRGSQDD